MTTAIKTADKPKVQTSNASKADAVTLGMIYSSLNAATKALKSAIRDLSTAWAKGDAAVAAARKIRDSGQAEYDAVYSRAWTDLNSLPNGTVASGGATPQTLALEFFSNSLNRELKNRITGADARAINRRSFV